jgi:hypothetical protein
MKLLQRKTCLRLYENWRFVFLNGPANVREHEEAQAMELAEKIRLSALDQQRLNDIIEETKKKTHAIVPYPVEEAFNSRVEEEIAQIRAKEAGGTVKKVINFLKRAPKEDRFGHSKKLTEIKDYLTEELITKTLSGLSQDDLEFIWTRMETSLARPLSASLVARAILESTPVALEKIRNLKNAGGRVLIPDNEIFRTVMQMRMLEFQQMPKMVNVAFERPDELYLFLGEIKKSRPHIHTKITQEMFEKDAFDHIADREGVRVVLTRLHGVYKKNGKDPAKLEAYIQKEWMKSPEIEKKDTELKPPEKAAIEEVKKRQTEFQTTSDELAKQYELLQSRRGAYDLLKPIQQLESSYLRAAQALEVSLTELKKIGVTLPDISKLNSIAALKEHSRSTDLLDERSVIKKFHNDFAAEGFLEKLTKSIQDKENGIKKVRPPMSCEVFLFRSYETELAPEIPDPDLRKKAAELCVKRDYAALRDIDFWNKGNRARLENRDKSRLHKIKERLQATLFSSEKFTAQQIIEHIAGLEADGSLWPFQALKTTSSLDHIQRAVSKIPEENRLKVLVKFSTALEDVADSFEVDGRRVAVVTKDKVAIYRLIEKLKKYETDLSDHELEKKLVSAKDDAERDTLRKNFHLEMGELQKTIKAEIQDEDGDFRSSFSKKKMEEEHGENYAKARQEIEAGHLTGEKAEEVFRNYHLSPTIRKVLETGVWHNTKKGAGKAFKTIGRAAAWAWQKSKKGAAKFFGLFPKALKRIGKAFKAIGRAAAYGLRGKDGHGGLLYLLRGEEKGWFHGKWKRKGGLVAWPLLLAPRAVVGILGGIWNLAHYGPEKAQRDAEAAAKRKAAKAHHGGGHGHGDDHGAKGDDHGPKAAAHH